MGGNKKKGHKQRVFAGPTAMEVQDPRQSPPEESLHRQQPPGGPRMESSAMDVILQLLREVSKDTKHLRAGQDSLFSEVAELKISIDQMNQWLDLAESRFSSLEDRACETHQTNSVMSASQSDPRAVPAASSSSFSSHQIILDDAQTAASPAPPSVYAGDASSEPAPLSLSEQFITTSSTWVYSETAEKAHQILADAGFHKSHFESETAQIEEEESGQQEYTLAGESLLIAPQYKSESQLLTSKDKAVQTFDAVMSQVKISESDSESADTEAEESDEQEDTLCAASPQEYKPKPQLLMNSLPETPQAPSPAEMGKEAPVTAAQLSRRYPTNKRSGGSAATSAGALRHLVSSPPAEVMSPTKRPRASIAWHYFRKHPTSKFIAICNICGVDVKTGKIGGCGRVGTSALLKHIKRIHHVALGKKVPSVSPAAISKTHDMGRPSTVERPHRIGSAASGGTATSAVTLCSPSSSPPTKVVSPAKHPRASIAWRYFTKHPTSKFIATCNICGVDVKTGKIGGCGRVGTSALLKHIKSIHHVVVKK